jgi:hypothetical protein
MIKTMRAKTQHQKGMGKSWAKEETLLQEAKRNIQELALKKRRTLP